MISLQLMSLNASTGSCADVMHSAKPFQNGFDETIIALVLRGVLRALRYLHSLGYIHRYWLLILLTAYMMLWQQKCES